MVLLKFSISRRYFRLLCVLVVVDYTRTSNFELWNRISSPNYIFQPVYKGPRTDIGVQHFGDMVFKMIHWYTQVYQIKWPILGTLATMRVKLSFLFKCQKINLLYAIQEETLTLKRTGVMLFQLTPF